MMLSGPWLPSSPPTTAAFARKWPKTRANATDSAPAPVPLRPPALRPRPPAAPPPSPAPSTSYELPGGGTSRLVPALCQGRVVEGGAQGAETGVVADVGGDAVAEDGDEALAFGVDPERAPGEAEGGEGGAGYAVAGEGALQGGAVPAEPPARARDPGGRPERAQHGAGHQRRPALRSGVPTGSAQGARHRGDRASRAEQAGVARHAAHHVGVEVVHLADQQPPAHRTALRRGDGPPAERRRGAASRK